MTATRSLRPRPRRGVALVVTLAILLALAMIVYSSMQQAQVTCEVCITFRGASQCRSATGPEREAAVRTATDNACAFLASGMADSIQCSNTPPSRVTCTP
ncbi:MAG TPA: hypothetical protein VFP98_08425 [Candidatus Polarisedimenticolia bacterium]|nr:hypothetical protein [Candidatus Polarisedimenticolia bacterium]